MFFGKGPSSVTRGKALIGNFIQLNLQEVTRGKVQ